MCSVHSSGALAHGMPLADDGKDVWLDAHLRVKLCEHNVTKETYALKCQAKKAIIDNCLQVSSGTYIIHVHDQDQLHQK